VNRRQALSSAARSNTIAALSAHLNSKSLLAKVAERSYRHSNGFWKVCVPDSDNSTAATRLHYWSAAAESHGEPSFHNHAWPFVSTVLFGALDVEFAELGDESSSGRGVRCWRLGVLDRPQVVDRGVVFLSVNSAARIDKGITYAQSAQTIHRVRSPSNATLTLVRQGSRARDYSDVYGCEPTSPYEIERLGTQGCKEVIELALTHLTHLHVASRIEHDSA
jgi:hypothetical protein